MSTAPVSPYPPDVDELPSGVVEFGDLIDVIAADLDWAGRRAPGFTARRAELRRSRLTGAELAESTLSDVTFDECRCPRAATG